MTPQLTFHGAARAVTGGEFLFDCGLLYQPALIRTLLPMTVGRWIGCAMAGR